MEAISKSAEHGVYCCTCDTCDHVWKLLVGVLNMVCIAARVEAISRSAEHGVYCCTCDHVWKLLVGVLNMVCIAAHVTTCGSY